MPHKWIEYFKGRSKLWCTLLSVAGSGLLLSIQSHSVMETIAADRMVEAQSILIHSRVDFLRKKVARKWSAQEIFMCWTSSLWVCIYGDKLNLFVSGNFRQLHGARNFEFLSSKFDVVQQIAACRRQLGTNSHRLLVVVSLLGSNPCCTVLSQLMSCQQNINWMIQLNYVVHAIFVLLVTLHKNMTLYKLMIGTESSE